MIVDKLVEKLPIRSNLTKLIAGSILAALVIALGMVVILKLIGFSINPAVPAVLGVVGGVAYAAATQKWDRVLLHWKKYRGSRPCEEERGDRSCK